MRSLWVIIPVLIALLMCSAFFASSEVAFMSVNQRRLERRRKNLTAPAVR